MMCYWRSAVELWMKVENYNPTISIALLVDDTGVLITYIIRVDNI